MPPTPRSRCSTRCSRSRSRSSGGLRSPCSWESPRRRPSNRDQAVAHLREAYERLEAPELKGAAAYALSRTLLFIGSAQAATDFAAEAAGELPEHLADLAKMIESIELTGLYFGARVRDAEARFAELRRLPDGASGGDGVLSAAASYDLMYRGGSAEECAALASEAIELAASLELDNGLAWVLANVVLVAAERPEATEVWDRALARSHRQGSMFGVLTVHLWRGFTELRHGELPAAEESLRAGIEQISLLGGATLDYAHGLLCSTLLARGQADAAEEALYAIGGRRERVTARCSGDRARSSCCSSRGATSRRSPRRCATPSSATGGRTPPSPRPSPSRRGRSTALAARDEALEVLGRELEAAEAWGAAGAVGRVLGCAGRSPGETGREDLERAVELLEDSPMRLELARALGALGSPLRRERKPTEAREPLRRALELAEVCEASPLAAHVRAELHATGARPRAARSAAPTRSPLRAPRGRPRRRRSDQQADRPGPLRHPEDRRGAPLQRVPEARHQRAPGVGRRAGLLRGDSGGREGRDAARRRGRRARGFPASSRRRSAGRS